MICYIDRMRAPQYNDCTPDKNENKVLMTDCFVFLSCFFFLALAPNGYGAVFDQSGRNAAFFQLVILTVQVYIELILIKCNLS